MKDLKTKFNNTGGISIETAVVMPIVLMVVLLLITMTHIMYEQTRVNAIVQDAAERAAVIYSVAGKDMIVGRVTKGNLSDKSPYWRLFDFAQQTRKKEVEGYALMKLNAFKINENTYVAGGSAGTRNNLKVEYQNYFIYKRVKVSVDKATYKVPFGGFLSLFINTDYEFEASATAAVSEQAEMIRNVDMVCDILGQFETIDKFRQKYGANIGKFADFINSFN